MKREIITKQSISNAMTMLDMGIAKRLREKGYGSFASIHEIQGIITEEFHEMIEAIHTRELVEEELMDIAVGCIFGVACILQGAVKYKKEK